MQRPSRTPRESKPTSESSSAPSIISSGLRDARCRRRSKIESWLSFSLSERENAGNGGVLDRSGDGAATAGGLVSRSDSVENSPLLDIGRWSASVSPMAKRARKGVKSSQVKSSQSKGIMTVGCDFQSALQGVDLTSAKTRKKERNSFFRVRWSMIPVYKSSLRLVLHPVFPIRESAQRGRRTLGVEVPIHNEKRGAERNLWQTHGGTGWSGNGVCGGGGAS